MKDDTIFYDKMIKVAVFFFFISLNSLEKSVLRKKKNSLRCFLLRRYPLRRYGVN